MCVEWHRADYFWVVDEVAAELGLEDAVVVVAKGILREARARRLTSGFKPSVLAAAALYVACRMCGRHVPQKVLAEAAGVTELAIRMRYHFLVSRLGLVLPG